MHAALLVSLALVGPVTHTTLAAVGQTDHERLVYVKAVDCRLGVGWIWSTATDGTDLQREGFYVLRSGTPISALARALCRPFTKD